MKLIQITTRYYLIFTLIIFGFGTLLFYFLIQVVLIDSIDEGLKQEKEQLIANLYLEKDIEELTPSENVVIHKIPRLNNVKDKYTTVEVPEPATNEIVDYRQLSSVFAYRGQYYEVIIRHSLAEAETLLQGLFPMVIILFLILLLGIFLMNNFVFKKLWEPFYTIITRLRNYDINKSGVLIYQHSGIQEFNELSVSVEKMTDRIYKDYLAQKEFNENSSHELQTPLAVIRNKLDLLIQSPNLKGEELELVDSIYESIKKLNLLNKGLILLNKIENRQYLETEELDLKLTIRKILDNFSVQIESCNLDVLEHTEPGSLVKGNKILFEILLNNLISNSIKHNITRGFIRITGNTGFLHIENSGQLLKEKPDTMFDRFKKSSDHPQSVGLGLAIVKKICESLNYEVNYQVMENKHQLEIIFPR